MQAYYNTQFCMCVCLSAEAIPHRPAKPAPRGRRPRTTIDGRQGGRAAADRRTRLDIQGLAAIQILAMECSRTKFRSRDLAAGDGSRGP